MFVFEDYEGDEILLNASTINCIIDNGSVRRIKTNKDGQLVTKESLNELKAKLDDLGIETLTFEYTYETCLVVKDNLYFVKNKRLRFLKEM